MYTLFKGDSGCRFAFVALTLGETDLLLCKSARTILAESCVSHTKRTHDETVCRLTCLSSSETVCFRLLVRSISCRFSSLRRRSRSWILAASRRRAASLASSRAPTERILAGVFQRDRHARRTDKLKVSKKRKRAKSERLPRNKPF